MSSWITYYTVPVLNYCFYVQVYHVCVCTTGMMGVESYGDGALFALAVRSFCYDIILASTR